MPQSRVGLCRVAGPDDGGGPPLLQLLLLPVDHRLDPAGVGACRSRWRRYSSDAWGYSDGVVAELAAAHE